MSNNINKRKGKRIISRPDDNYFYKKDNSYEGRRIDNDFNQSNFLNRRRDKNFEIDIDIDINNMNNKNRRIELGNHTHNNLAYEYKGYNYFNFK